MARKKLTDLKARKAVPKESTYRLADGGGLFLEVRPNGARYWRYAYRHENRQKTLALGVYGSQPPALTLATARDAHAAAYAQVRAGLDPVVQRNIQRAEVAAAQRQQKAECDAEARTYKTVADAWLAAQTPRWNPKHAARVRASLERELYPHIGALPIRLVTVDQVIKCIRRVEQRGALDHAKRTLQRVRGVFRYALALEYISADPLAALSVVFTPTVLPVTHQPALPLAELPAFWERLDSDGAHIVNKIALQLLMLTMLRPGELRDGRWCEVDTDSALWTIPGARMKIRRRKYASGNEILAAAHKVPLSRQALELLAELHSVTGHQVLLFPSELSPERPISDGTLNVILHRLGYKGRATAHGFRSVASSVLNESGRFHSDAVELQLAHRDPDKVRAAYNRSDRLPERHRMMQWLADYYDSTKPGVNVVPLAKVR